MLGGANQSSYNQKQRHQHYDEMISATFTLGTTQYLYYPVNSPNSRGTIFTISVDRDGVFTVVPGEGSHGVFDGYKLAYSYIADPSTGKLGVRAYDTSSIPKSFAPYVPENDETPVVKAAYTDLFSPFPRMACTKSAAALFFGT